MTDRILMFMAKQQLTLMTLVLAQRYGMESAQDMLKSEAEELKELQESYDAFHEALLK